MPERGLRQPKPSRARWTLESSHTSHRARPPPPRRRALGVRGARASAGRTGKESGAGRMGAGRLLVDGVALRGAAAEGVEIEAAHAKDVGRRGGVAEGVRLPRLRAGGCFSRRAVQCSIAIAGDSTPSSVSVCAPPIYHPAHPRSDGRRCSGRQFGRSARQRLCLDAPWSRAGCPRRSAATGARA